MLLNKQARASKKFYNRCGGFYMKPFRIIATTDVHGSLLSHSYTNNERVSSGLSRFSTALKYYQSQECILIDNGDVLQGTPLTTFNNKYEESSIMADAFNALNYDYYNLGNHDFNYGQEVLGRYINQQQAKPLCCNILIDEKPVGKTQIYTTQEGLKLAFIGVVTDYIENWEKPENINNIKILDVFDIIQKEVDQVRQQVDHVIVVYHGGFERDLITNEPTERLTGENIGSKLTTIKGIDVIISGHQHRSFVVTINDVLCLQCANNASEFMMIEYNGSFKGHVIPTNQFNIDHDFEKLFYYSEKKTQEWLDAQIGQGPDMTIDNVFQAQLNKPMFTSFINQFAREYFKADLAFSSLFNNSPGLGPNITMRDLVASYPFPNTLTLIEIDKETLLDYLEQNATYFILKNDEIGINPKFIEPKLQMYNYDMGDGLSYTIDVSLPEGQRIKDLVLPDKETFTMVTNNYRASGGGDFYMIKNCPKIKEDPNEVVDLLYDYILNNSPLQINHEHNILVVNKEN